MQIVSNDIIKTILDIFCGKVYNQLNSSMLNKGIVGNNTNYDRK